VFWGKKPSPAEPADLIGAEESPDDEIALLAAVGER
jgi:hypothetical protein